MVVEQITTQEQKEIYINDILMMIALIKHRTTIRKTGDALWDVLVEVRRHLVGAVKASPVERGR